MLSRTASVGIAVLLMSSVIDAGQLGRLFGRDQKFKPYKSAALTMEYPDNWIQHPSLGNVVVMFSTSRADTSIAVERVRLSQPLVAAEMSDLSANLEAEDIKEQYPDATEIKSVLAAHPTLGRVIRSEYKRPGSAGPARPDRVRQFSIPSGSFLYKIIFRAREADFAKQAPLFDHVISTVKIIDAPAKEGL